MQNLEILNRDLQYVLRIYYYSVVVAIWYSAFTRF